ncbi:MAG: flagellar hook-basal body complex protein, partial [Kofleriaceae bacterium]
MNSLYIGVNGLTAHGDAISIVGDNIANTSTVGFKRERAQFSDMLGGVINGQRAGGGVRLGAAQTMFEQGQLTSTGNALDMGISGHGLFVVNGNHDGHDANFYTRNGQFHLDNKGTVVNSEGLKLQGYTMDANGVRGTKVGDLALGSTQSPAVATTRAKLTMQLQADSPVVTGAFDPLNPNTTSTYATSMTAYDSLGKSHQVQMYYRNMGGNNWEVHSMVDGGEAGGTAGTPIEIATGNISFDGSGNFVSSTVTPANVTFTNANAQTIAFDFSEATQRAGQQSATNASDIDGHAAGNLTDVSVNSDGTIEGIYDNGDKRTIAQVAIASVQNEEGLSRAG